jgi:murein DD-endopeptidase MepM/ murein hydrolase activator NlpD
VVGKDDKAIQSFWGAPRDGGKRSHEGNDIFAPKGTNLLALTDGEITRLTNTGIGGKTVWLYDRERDLRYYYAHLDEQLVRKGQWVQRGDVVGTVGNTGNARTTPPHLHFGIYDNGAIDPYTFLQRIDALPPNSPLPIREPAKPMQVPGNGHHYLRLSLGSDGSVIRQLNNGETVTVLGVTGRFRRIKTERGEIGYANFD